MEWFKKTSPAVAQPASTTQKVVAVVFGLAGLAIVGVGVHSMIPGTHAQASDEADLTRLVQVVRTAPTDGTNTRASVRSVFPDGHLRSGGTVRVIKSAEHTDVLIDKSSLDACKTMVREGFMPEAMETPAVWINGVVHPLPGDPDALCVPKGDAGLNLAWRMKSP